MGRCRRNRPGARGKRPRHGTGEAPETDPPGTDGYRMAELVVALVGFAAYRRPVGNVALGRPDVRLHRRRRRSGGEADRSSPAPGRRARFETEDVRPPSRVPRTSTRFEAISTGMAERTMDARSQRPFLAPLGASIGAGLVPECLPANHDAGDVGLMRTRSAEHGGQTTGSDLNPRDRSRGGPHAQAARRLGGTVAWERGKRV